MLLTDTTRWLPGELQHYRDSLEAEDYRVLISGYPGESPAELTARLPWLLQPGVHVFVYDPALAGPAGADSLRTTIARLGREIPVEVLDR